MSRTEVGWAVLLSPPAAAEFHTAGRETTDGVVQIAGTHSPAALPCSVTVTSWLACLDISSFTREPRAGRGSAWFVLGERERSALSSPLQQRELTIPLPG